MILQKIFLEIKKTILPKIFKNSKNYFTKIILKKLFDQKNIKKLKKMILQKIL